MTSNNLKQKNGSDQQDEVVLQDLQAILRKSIGNDVIVVDYSTTSLLPNGENYGSTMLKVESVIKKSRNSPEEKLPLVAKMIPTSEFQKEHFNPTASFTKEIFFFETLIRKYQELQKDAGVDEKELLNILPKYYGGRLTRNVENSDVADNDAVILMENLKVRGYYTSNRMHGLDFHHAKMAITELAKFHALGKAMRVKNPKFINDAKENLNAFPFNLKDGEFNDVIDHMVNTVCKNPTIAKYRDLIKSNLGTYNWNTFQVPEENEPWVTIIHGDFWVNNIMFHQNNGKADDVKFIDFQMAQISSPQKDLPYFLCGSLHADVMKDRFEELLETYYNKFIKTLNDVGQDTTALSRQSFDEQLRKAAISELFHCLVAVQFFTQKGGDDLDLNDLKSSVMMSDTNELFEKRAMDIILKFVEKGWL